jgi:hypothetical protein
MIKFYIETYINNLHENTEHIIVDLKKIHYLPDLNRFNNLKILWCHDNQLTSLPNLSFLENLQELICCNNLLICLPNLNKNLKILNCSNNYLTCLPNLNENLQILNCSINQLTCLPSLNENLYILYYFYNPIYTIIDSDNLVIIRKKLKILYIFRHLYYSLKFKSQFWHLLWKIREPKIIKKYHPSYLEELLKDDVEGTLDIDMVLDNW